ncbi:hypothetical protein [Parasediminibacterium sp. JCM 36343]|uniref:hypothetical protein n=1 Tax=Parasediminibacterium sp. JCM 36343 TaxID=3374279 RepID=UPI00397CBB2F
MKRTVTICNVFFFMLLSIQTGICQVNQNPKWDNSLVSFSFNAQQGKFSITDKRTNQACIENATFQINKYASNQGYTFAWDAQPIKDELGTGNKITIEGKKAGVPSLILEVFIYKDNGAIALNLGIENTSDTNIRIMRFFPLKGIAYKGVSFDDYKALDGENGFAFTTVATKDTLKSLNNLLATFGKKGEKKRSLVIGGLTYNEFQKYASVIKKNDFLEVELKGEDPIGKLVDAKSRYILKDKFYVDFTTDNRFEALEKYGLALKNANHSDVSGVTIPILNFWYCFVAKFGGDKFRDNTLGTIEEMEEVTKTGFLKYSPVGLRLEPDDYSLPNNQQGWWDNKHWQMYKSGQLLPPYETIEKWGKKVYEMNGVPFIYCQTSKRSEDYCLQYPNHILFNDPYHKRSKGPVGWWGRSGDSTAIYWTYDFTDTGFINHMKDVYKNLKSGGVQGIKFDYPETGWSYDGGFEDKYATTTSAYRNIFKLAYVGLGPKRDVQERIPPYGDIALGVITTQRTEGDNDRVYPGRVTKTGLRWYKNRVVTNYDCDPINPSHVYPTNTLDGWKAAITMTYTTSGRMEIGKYFEKMDSKMIYALSRAVPLLAAPTASARPIDAFTGKLYPQVYDFKINPDWHIVTFYNTEIEGEEWPTDVMAYWPDNKQFIPKKMVSAVVNVPLGDNTDDGGLALDTAKKYYVFDFWNWKFVGKLEGSSKLEQELRPGEARVMAVHEAKEVPQFLSTDRHILQGYLDMAKYPAWDAAKKELGGTSKLIGGEEYKVIIATNGYKVKTATAEDATNSFKLIDKENSIYELVLKSKETKAYKWKVSFQK